MLILAVAVCIALFVGLSNKAEIGRLLRQVKTLHDQNESLQRQINALRGTAVDERADVREECFTFTEVEQTEEELVLAEEVAADEQMAESFRSAREESQATGPTRATKASRDSKEKAGINWMIWLGGACVSLAGIFLVKYSMDRGYFGPTARIVAGFILGAALHVAAEHLRRKNKSSHGSLAALAGGGSITLFATLLASHHLYNLLPPMVVFVGLTVVALGTMASSLFHGPFLAAIGLIGAYLVPILVETGSQNINALMIYSLIVSVSAYLLLTQVYRIWLWAGALAGSALWCFASLVMSKSPTWHGIYLGIAGILFISLVEDNEKLASKVGRYTKTGALIGIVLLQGLAFVLQKEWSFFAIQWLPVVWVVFNSSKKDGKVGLPAWVLIFTHIVGTSYLADSHFFTTGYEWMAVPSALIFSGMSLWVQRHTGPTHSSAAMAWLSPLFWVAAAYTFFPETHGSFTFAAWILVVGLSYAILLGRQISQQKLNENATWLAVAAHAAYSMAAVIYFKEATLTLALAVQAPSLVWLATRYKVPYLDILIKVILGIVGTRLTLAPILFKYPVGTHWSLWTYGGSFLSVLLATRMTSTESKLRPWLEGSAIHALILFVGAEIRYYLYDGDVFAHRYTMKEAAINCTLWGASAVSYWRRSLVAQWAEAVYRFYAAVLMIFATLNYLMLIVRWNPIVHGHEVYTPFFNILLLAYGAPVVIWFAAALYFNEKFSKYFFLLAAFSAWVFVSLEIRHFWHLGEALRKSSAMSNGELYTYSLAWLAMAVAAYLFGVANKKRGVYLGGLTLLGLVIAKIFLVDMAGLEGLYRVFSFMGLGLSLLGLAFLHQKLDPPKS